LKEEEKMRTNMSGWNLPPGCNVSDLPGNRPEDEQLESAEGALMDELCKIRAQPEEYAIVIAVGVAAIKSHRALVKDIRKEWACDAEMERIAREANSEDCGRFGRGQYV
jgi:hypothetical protein